MGLPCFLVVGEVGIAIVSLSGFIFVQAIRLFLKGCQGEVSNYDHGVYTTGMVWVGTGMVVLACSFDSL